MKNHRIILVALLSVLLSGCVGKEVMDSFTSNWWIALYFITAIFCGFFAGRYSNRLAFYLGVISMLDVVGSILYRCGYFH